MTKKACFFFSMFALVLGFGLLVFAGMSSDKYHMTTSVISGGGEPMISTSYQMDTTLGQSSPVMDPANPPGSILYNLYPGFWYTLDATLDGCWWDVEPEFGDGDVDGSDLAEFATGIIFDLEGFANEFGRTDCFD